MLSLKESRISRILMLYILFFSTIITLFITTTSVYVEYKQDIDSIRTNIKQIEKSYLDSISNSLWQFDSIQLETLVRGISKVPDIVYVEVSSANAQVYSVGKLKESNIIERNYPLVVHQPRRTSKLSVTDQKLGNLKIVASLEGVYSRLKTRILVVLFSQSIKTFLVSLFIYLLVIRLITSRLLKVTSFLGNFDINSGPHELNIKRAGSKNEDELDLVAASIVDFQNKLRRNYSELRSKEEKLRKLSKRLIHSQEEERSKISRDLHDDIGQKLAVLKLSFASNCKKMNVPADNLIECKEIMFEQIDDLVKSVRDVAKRLSPTILYSFGVVDAIKWLLDESFKNTDIEYSENLDTVSDVVDVDLNLAIFRIVQESLSNILRYADARFVEVSLSRKDGVIKLVIRDDGVGMSESDLDKTTSTGIVGIKERLRSFNGTFSIKNCSKLRGVVTEITIPVENI